MIYAFMVLVGVLTAMIGGRRRWNILKCIGFTVAALGLCFALYFRG